MSAPRAAVEIARRAMSRWFPFSGGETAATEAVEALAAAGWLHDPARVAAMEAEVARLREDVAVWRATVDELTQDLAEARGTAGGVS